MICPNYHRVSRFSGVLALLVLVLGSCTKDDSNSLAVSSPLQILDQPNNWHITGSICASSKLQNSWYWGYQTLSGTNKALIAYNSGKKLIPIPVLTDNEVEIQKIEFLNNQQLAFVGSLVATSNNLKSKAALVGVLDFSGNLVWWDSINGVYNDEFIDLNLLTDGSIAAVGSQQTSPTAYKTLLAVFNSNGQRRWVKKIPGNALIEKGLNITSLNNNEVLITQSISSGVGRNIYPVIRSLNVTDGSDGVFSLELVSNSSFRDWGNLFYRQTENWNLITEVKSDGDIVLIGQQLVDETAGNPKTKLFCASISKIGSVKWTKSYEFLYDVCYLNKAIIGDTIVAAIAYLNNNQIANEILLLDSLGMPIGQLPVDIATPTYDGILNDISIELNGYIIEGQFINKLTGEKDLFQLKINKNGTVQKL